MDASNAVATREVFDAWTQARLERCIGDLQQRARIAERQYPRSTAQAVDELRFRGFAADVELAERHAERAGVETFGGELAWFRSDIDALGEFCEGANKLMIGTRHRLMRGISWSQDHAD